MYILYTTHTHTGCRQYRIVGHAAAQRSIGSLFAWSAAARAPDVSYPPMYSHSSSSARVKMEYTHSPGWLLALKLAKCVRSCVRTRNREHGAIRGGGC